MKLRSRALVVVVGTFAVGAVLGCSSSSKTTPGSGGSTGTGGTGTGGASAGGAGGGFTGTGGRGGGTAMGGAGGRGGAGGVGGAGGTVLATCGPFANGGGPGGASGAGGGSPASTMTFFVSSQKNMTGDLGGLAAADTRCQTLAAAVGRGSKTWHAYLSVEHDAMNGNNPTNAKDRIGTGPWFNAKGVMVAMDVASLHARTGDPTVFIDETGNMINGQWTASPTPNEHDILTGTNADGTLAVGKTCVDWTSNVGIPDAGVPDGGTPPVARVGHADGFGGMCSTATTPNNFPSWNSAHDNGGCDNTVPRGGAGRIYCFAIN